MTATLVLMATLVGYDGYGYGGACGGYYGSYGYYGGYPAYGYTYGWLPYHHYSTWGGPTYYAGNCCSGPTYDGSNRTTYTAPTESAPPPPAETHRVARPDFDTPQRVVRMTAQYRFEPAQITIRVGDTVEWRNDTGRTQVVIADPEKAIDAAHVELPNDAQPFDSGEIFPGGTFKHSFDVPGTYVYVCRTHEAEGMAGIVVVEDEGAPGTRSGPPRPLPPEEAREPQPPTPGNAPPPVDNQDGSAASGSKPPPPPTAGEDF